MDIRLSTERAVDFVNFFCRLVLGGAFIVVVVQHGLSRGIPGTGDNCAATLPGADIAISLLLSVAGVWLLFGIYTRVMTVMSVVLYAAFQYLAHCHGSMAPEPWALTNALLICAVPLVFFGGGSFAMFKRGWSLPI